MRLPRHPCTFDHSGAICAFQQLLQLLQQHYYNHYNNTTPIAPTSTFGAQNHYGQPLPSRGTRRHHNSDQCCATH